MKQYLDLLQDVLDNGVDKDDRTGTGTRSVFGRQARFNLAEGFPLLTTKKIFTKAIIHELLWFLRGDTNIKYLNDNGVHIWDDWADENGFLGQVYGAQWRRWQAFKFEFGYGIMPSEANNWQWDGVLDRWTPYPIDQIANVIKRIQTNPDCRRLIVSAWNPGEIDDMALPPCHCLFQFYVADGKLSCQLYQRSCDIFLGVPFNIASYALLTMMIAQVTGLQLGEFIHTFGDLHIYQNHMKQVEEQMKRKPHKLPTMVLNPEVLNINDFKYEDFELINYDPHPAIKAPIAI